MRILLTRPEADSRVFAGRLAAHGIDTLIAPMMTVTVENGPPPDVADVQALLLTSANGVRAFSDRSPVRDLPVFAVGDATAATARDAGMSRVESAGGDVDDLARLVADRLDPAAGALLHVAGSAVAGDLAGSLEKCGFTYRRAVLYRAEMARVLPEPVADALKTAALDGVALFSPRSATTFTQRVADAALNGALRRLTAFALSANVAAALDADTWGDIEISATPTADDLLEVVLAAARTR